MSQRTVEFFTSGRIAAEGDLALVHDLRKTVLATPQQSYSAGAGAAMTSVIKPSPG